MSEFHENAEQPTAQITVRVDLAQFDEAMHEIQDAVTFSLHPDLTRLDDELDTLYRGQL